MPLPDAFSVQFDQLLGSSKFAQARALADRLIRQYPNEAMVYDMLRTLLAQTDAHPRTVLDAARKAVELDPTHAGLRNSLTAALSQNGEDEAALAESLKVIELDPTVSSYWVNTAAMFMRLSRLADCEAHCRRGLERFPECLELSQTLAAALLEQGRAADAEAILSGVMFDNRADLMMAGFICSVANYRSPPDRAKLISQHKNFGRLLVLSDLFTPYTHKPPTPTTPGARPPGQGKHGRIRVAFMSSDLRTHSVSYFLEPILRRLDRSRFEVLCYSTHAFTDETTRRLQTLTAADPLPDPDNPPPLPETGPPRNWRRAVSLMGSHLAKQIHTDRIDVLFDINGLTLGCRADALRFKPAPVIVNYLGYPATSGIAAVDYRLVDSITDPPGCEDAATEKLLRLDPCFLCYRPPASVRSGPQPEMVPLDDGVVFGSFNNFMKFNDEVAALWSRLLHAVPRSRLLLKAASLKDEGVRTATFARFARHDIPAERVTLLATIKGVADHLAAYSRIHVALDPFPYAGTTTTLEAIAMGVPVVTLAPPSPGAMHAHRVGASLLTAIGHPELIAETPEQYITIAAALANDAARLRSLRQTLRAELLASPLCNEVAFARRFAEVIETMWATYAACTPKA